MEFRYADQEEQLKRANHFLIIGYAVFYAVLLAIMWTCCAMGVRSMGLTGLVSAIELVSFVILFIVYKKNPASTKLKIVAVPLLLLTCYVTGFAFTQGFIQVFGMFPLVGCVIFFDRKFSFFSGVAYLLMEVLVTIGKITQHQNLEGDAAINQLFVVVIVMVLLFLLVVMTNIAEQFNKDTLGEVQARNAKMKTMLDDVIGVAAEVRKGTESAMDIVNDLNGSSEVVNGAMKNISESTLSTAENIQTQTTMTANIQESIEQTLQNSETMVDIAKQSSEINKQSMEVMSRLKEQSQLISHTNKDVAEAMEALQKKTEEVRNIADTILAISGQTNLLALNASIESARAGEAGRGFAVVADQIGKLAADSAKSAVNTRDLIDKTLVEIEKGNAITRTTAEAFNQIIADMESFAELAENTMEKANSQAESLEQIGQGIEQLSGVVQGNAASSEENTAISINLADGAAKMHDRVNIFKLF